MRKRNKGSVTVEATLTLSMFIFVMVGLMSLINVCRVQTMVGNALHMAAMDISHMSYLLEITGLYELSVDVHNAGTSAGEELAAKADRADDVLAGVEAMTDTFNAQMESFQSVTPDDSLKDLGEQLKNTTDTLEDQAVELQGNFDALVQEGQSIMENPMGFVKTMLQYGIGKGVGTAQNLVAGAFAKGLITSHIQAGDVITDADAYLKQMGVVDGLSGMNFMASTLFGGEDQTDINLVVVYDVEVFHFFGDFFTMNVVQSASTRAWLAGDVQTVTTIPEPEAEEPEEENSVWNEANFSKASILLGQFHDAHDDTGTYTKLAGNSGYYGYEDSTATVFAGKVMDPFSKSYRKADGTFNPTATGWKTEIAKKLPVKTSVNKDGGGKLDLSGKELTFNYVIQVPENITDADLAVLQADVNSWLAAHADSYTEEIKIDIVKTGGNAAPTPAEE